LFAALFVLERRQDSGFLHTKGSGGGENHTRYLVSNVRAEGSGWHESHWFHWGWSAANPKRAHAAPAHQQNLPKHSLDAAGELAGQERASQLWHTTWISLLLCFVGLFSKAGLVVSFV